MIIFIMHQGPFSIKSPRLLRTAFDRKPFLITDKHTDRDLGLYSMCHGDFPCVITDIGNADKIPISVLGAFAALGKPSPNIDRYVTT